MQYVLDLALGLGATLLSSGVGAVDVTASMNGVVQAYGLRKVQIEITFNRITVSYRRRFGDDPQTVVHQVPARSLDYTRLHAADRLVQRIVAGQLSPEEAHAQLDEIVTASHRYPRWVSTIALSVMAAALAFLLGSGPAVAAVGAVVTAAIDRIGRLLNRRGTLLFFQQALGAAIATGVAVLLTVADFSFATNPSLIVAASIIVLLAGQAVVGSVQDALTGHYLTAVARGVEIGLLSVGLFVGVTAALRVAVLFGVEVSVTPQIALALVSVPTKVAAGALAAAAAAVASYAPPRGALAGAAAGATGSAVFLMLSYAGLDQVMSALGAATLIGLAGSVLSRRMHIPPLVIAMAGIIPLVPGLATYRGFVHMATGETAQGLSSLSQAIATALALAAGVLLGQYLGQPVRQKLSKLERQYRGPRLAGPRSSETEDRAEREDTTVRFEKEG